MNDLGRLWEWFADTSCRGYSPLYDRICRAVARDDELIALVREAPPAAHQPTVLLAAVHYLLLDGLDHLLAAVYAGRSDADVASLFREVCFEHRAALLELMETGRTQTNECGRSAAIGPALTWVARRSGTPLALVDVGTSAGLNLGCDRYLLDYGNAGSTGPPDAAVRIACAVRGGAPPIAPRLPDIAARIGLDQSPVDLTDEREARWLLACVWPDTGRLERTRAAIRDTQEHPPTIMRGDMVDDLPPLVADLPRNALACAITTWAFAYLSLSARAKFVDQLASVGRTRPVVWISGEGPGVVSAFADVRPPDADGIELSVLGAIGFDGGKTDATTLAFVHPHGASIDWLAAD